MTETHPSVLITDDDRNMRETLRDVLARRGFRAYLAQDGDEAVTIIRREKIHLALLDMYMPRLNGLEAIQKLKRVQRVLPWILISGDLDDQIIKRARQADVFHVLSKPVTAKEVTVTVMGAMRQTYQWFDRQ